MNNIATIESNAFLYEIFLKKGLKFDKRIARPSKRELINLINAEKGKKDKYLGSKQQQLEKIKIRILKSLELIIKNNDFEKSKGLILNNLINDIEGITNSNEVVSFVKSAMEIF